MNSELKTCRVSCRLALNPRLLAIASVLLALSLTAIAHSDDAGCVPDVPAALRAPDGNRVSLHVFAVGVQIYTAAPSITNPNQLVWTFKAPEATLYEDMEAAAEGEEAVGIHYAGPTWENARGKVVGARVAGATVDPTSIPWLLLQAVSTSGHGILARATYIQRVNTVGGLAPTTVPTRLGEEVRVPYTAEYYFYRASSPHPHGRH